MGLARLAPPPLSLSLPTSPSLPPPPLSASALAGQAVTVLLCSAQPEPQSSGHSRGPFIRQWMLFAPSYSGRVLCWAHFDLFFFFPFFVDSLATLGDTRGSSHILHRPVADMYADRPGLQLEYQDSTCELIFSTHPESDWKKGNGSSFPSPALCTDRTKAQTSTFKSGSKSSSFSVGLSCG